MRAARVVGVAIVVAGVLFASRTRGAPPVRVDALPADLGGTWDLAMGDPAAGLAGARELAFRPVPVPGTWQAAGVKGHGVGWYRLAFDVNPSLFPVPLALAFEQIRDADEVYLDGVLVGRTGRFPPAYEKATLMGRVYVLPSDITSRPGTHELLVRVYNAGPRGGGISGHVEMDAARHAFVHRARRELPRLLLAAAIGALGLFSVFVFLRDRSQTDFLMFFLYTTGFAIYIGTWTSAWVETRVPLTLLFRLNFALAFGLFSLFLLFFLRFFERTPRPRHRVLMAVQGAGSLFCLFWPRADDIYYAVPVAYVAIFLGSIDVWATLTRDARRGVPYARPFLAGCVVVFSCVVFDIGQDLGAWGDPVGSFRVVGPGFLLFSLVVLSLAADRIAKLRVAARSDPLTGLANRSVLYERLVLELSRARRAGTPMAVAVLDLDHFKLFNDRFGHLAGDKLLVGVAGAMREATRDTDLVTRYGGEEFVVLLPETGRDEALVCLERLRLSVAQVRVSVADVGTTVSIGVALYEPGTSPPSFSSGSFLRQADGALYVAKAQGRDRIVVAEGAPQHGGSSGVFSQEVVRPRFR